ncbi:MAG: hypothetical protein JXR83_16260 [Deltaproteobacteria bacterium]|nr:hypothetical protein [Deltaproteobacteria bacterium]
MTRIFQRAATLTLLIGAAGSSVGGCHLLVGDYSIRDGPEAAAESEAGEPGGQPGTDRIDNGKSARDAPLDDGDAGRR